ncbi:alpha/beta fold hydrolase [Lutimonas saemankumensis]|uniref:alpha/beta fold hydrolase n=1 Tax=Lutimonas saemankumensis TaxID=483016 RepID=UPI001CD5BAAF|nr:alpha/beta fold hydrolase [Lutimonas saemankumensis]MCA0933530.1 alpha/beta fold hydrolase [Lutimonas saemankumensis]
MSVLHSLILGKGEPLIILHGFLGMGDNWKTLANRFAEDFQVHIVDQRNHGRSFHSDDFSYELMSEDLMNYMNHHHLESAHILGHSMGGKTGMLFSVEYPEKVKNLIVADIGPKYYPPHHQSILDALGEVDFETMTSRAEIEQTLKKHIPDMGIRQFLLKSVYRKTPDELAFRFNFPVLEDLYEEVGVPLPPRTIFEGKVLFLKGALSGYITSADEDLIMAHFPNSRIQVVQRASHWLHSENPSDFYDYVVGFLEND